MSRIRKSNRMCVAIIMAVLMAFGLAAPAFAADTALEMTEVQTPNTPNMSRATGWDDVPGAELFVMFLFDNYQAATDATVDTVAELAAASAEFEATGERIETDVRMITFSELNDSGVVRATPLPSGWEVAGLGASAPAAGSEYGAYETNLVPGQYWIRVLASAEGADSALSEVQTIVDSFNIAMGPDEVRAYIESRLDDIGTTLHIIDIRGENPQESSDEGYLRFTSTMLPTLRFSPDTRQDADLIAQYDAVLLAGVGNDVSRRGEVTVMLY